MPRVIVFGSMNMDLSIEAPCLPAAGETLAGSGFITAAGGKGANQAVAASRMGADVRMVAAVGADDPSTRIEATIAGSTARIAGVPLTASSCARRSPPTPVSVASSSLVRSPTERAGVVIGTMTPTGAEAAASGTTSTLAVVRSPRADAYVAVSGYTPGASCRSPVASGSIVAVSVRWAYASSPPIVAVPISRAAASGVASSSHARSASRVGSAVSVTEMLTGPDAIGTAVGLLARSATVSGWPSVRTPSSVGPAVKVTPVVFSGVSTAPAAAAGATPSTSATSTARRTRKRRAGVDVDEVTVMGLDSCAIPDRTIRCDSRVRALCANRDGAAPTTIGLSCGCHRRP